MEFDAPELPQLDFVRRLSNQNSTLHEWAKEHVSTQERLNSAAKTLKSSVSKIKRLASRKAGRPEANAKARQLICSMPNLEGGYDGYLIYKLREVAVLTNDWQLAHYCTAAGYRLMRNTPALRAHYADCAFFASEAISENYLATDKRISRKKAWAERATRDADSRIEDFNWLPFAWHDLGICAYIQRNLNQAEDAINKAILITNEHPMESGYFICQLHILQAEIMRELKRPDQQLAHFETANALLDDITKKDLQEMMRRRLNWALARSAKNKHSADLDFNAD
jgi:tetratricopeptide (TPR) repeat protein